MTRKYRVSTGKNFVNKVVKVQEVSADVLVKRLRRFHVSDLKRADYRTLDTEQKAALKKLAGFFIGGDGGGAKTGESWRLNSLATLDLDDLTPERAKASIKAVEALGAHAVFYSTASHSPEKPRLRAVIFLAQDVAPDDYSHMIGRLASRLPLGAVSRESYTPAQIMYFPQRCSDGEQFFVELPGEPLEVAPLLAEHRVETASARPKKVTPAWDKPGIVGAVARRYGDDLDAAIDELSIENVPYEASSTDPTCAIGERRYTRVGASGVDGALWYPNDGHMYSHHGGSDPGAGMSQTIFDIVRLTHWKKRDKGLPKDTPIHKLPSHAACEAWFIDKIPELQETIVAHEEFDNLGKLEATSDAAIDPKKESRFRPIPIGEFSDSAEPEWIVNRVLPHAELAVIFGESGCGKSFFALDMMMAIARGIPWYGLETEQGKVAYVCGESPRGFNQRAKAYAHHHGASLSALGDAFCIVPCAPDLLNMQDVSEVIRELLVLGRLAVVVIDTFARATPGANENSGEDMGLALKHCQRIHAETGALVMLIHHSGKDQSRGARGWSGTRAAADTEIEITRVGGNQRCATLTKQRDGEDGVEFGFELLLQPYGYAANGDELSSLIVKPRVAVGKQKVKPPTAAKQLVIWQTLHAAGGSLQCTELLEQAAPKLSRVEGKPDRRRQYAREALDALIGNGKLVNVQGVVTFAGVVTAGEWDQQPEETPARASVLQEKSIPQSHDTAPLHSEVEQTIAILGSGSDDKFEVAQAKQKRAGAETVQSRVEAIVEAPAAAEQTPLLRLTSKLDTTDGLAGAMVRRRVVPAANQSAAEPTTRAA